MFEDISRFMRDLRGHLEISDQLRRAGCLLCSPGREFRDDADSRLVENLLASMAEHQRDKN
ncbi:recombinase family protein [Cognatishimia sp. WU-CL00825]|uniref:recombinase family protein n=1 Tax=Cognatishimia sp. WU-CL00825 TaxID=3127658 RepID=UPI0033653B8C